MSYKYGQRLEAGQDCTGRLLAPPQTRDFKSNPFTSFLFLQQNISLLCPNQLCDPAVPPCFITSWPKSSFGFFCKTLRILHPWTLPGPKWEERRLGRPVEVRVCMASYAKSLKRLLEFQRMNGPQRGDVSGGRWVTEPFIEEGNDLCSKDGKV